MTQQTTTTAGRTYDAFTSHGNTYHTATQVMGRLAQLTHLNYLHGESDGRVTEANLLFEDLGNFLAGHGAEDPLDATARLLTTVTWVTSHTTAPTLSLLEEAQVAIHHSNAGTFYTPYDTRR